MRNNIVFNVDFMKMRRVAIVLSTVLTLASIVSLATKGLNFGLDFTGGTIIEVSYQQPMEAAAVREQLGAAGFENFTVVNFGSETEILIRLQESQDPLLGDKILNTLRQNGLEVERRRMDYVGPQVGSELRDQGSLGMLVAMMMMMVYIAVRFQSKFAIGAMVALVHDVIFTIGFFSFFGWNFDLTVLAAILALIGYSVNDTIVVFDRVRENLHGMRKASMIEIVNTSLNQTLGRTIITGVTTLLVLFALLFFGGESVHDFAVALIIGILIGTYSSIYVASSILIAMKATREDLLAPVQQKDGVFDDGMP